MNEIGLKNIDKGNNGENVAASYLLQNGYGILERNWRFKHWEIDIIAFRDNKLHFIEVKTRTSKKFGNPEQSVTEKKMNSLKKVLMNTCFKISNGSLYSSM